MSDRKTYYIFDGRYHTNPDRAIVLECMECTEKTAKRCLKRDHPADAVLVDGIQQADGTYKLGKVVK